ncbi:MAG: aminotransferase class V-fold PLP-dependent enzyme [Ignavibacteriae bacterium]|nr:aminotransferase class V-fold PLP-dependent enzyme [Ignavibacteriota bacterium]
MALIPPTTLDRARSLFPYLASGHVYLNHAATSPLATPVVNALSAHIANRATGEIDTYGDDLPMIKEWRKNVCRLINAEGPERIGFAMNTSDALNIVAAGLPWRDGNHILLNNAEFPANLHPFLHLRRHGVQVDMMQVENGIVTPEIIAHALRPDTRLLAISAVQFLSGYRADLEAIGALCRDRSILFVVDGIQAVGAVPIDVQAMHIDCLAAGAQKWQMSPQGTGFLYVTDDLQSSITQQHVGWLSVATPWNFKDLDQELDGSARRYEGGTLNITGMHAMNAALTMLLEVGVDAIAGHILTITGVLMQALTGIEGVHCVTPADPNRRAGIVTVRPPAGLRAEELAVHMRNAGVTIAVREGLLRFSPHFYNTPDEMQRAASALKDAIARSRSEAGAR